MDRSEENKIFGISLFLLVAAICVMCLFASCGASKKTMTETKFYTDTVFVTKGDTTVQYRVVQSVDTLIIQKERTITLLQPFDKSLPPETLKVVSNTDTKQISNLNDSIYQLKAIIDKFIDKSAQKDVEKEKVVKRVIPWQEYIMFLGGVVFFGLCLWVLCGRSSSK